MVAAWGPPQSVYKGEEGARLYTWERTESAFAYLNRNPYGRDSQRTYWCKTTFVADASGVVVSWRWDGNGCELRPSR